MGIATVTVVFALLLAGMVMLVGQLRCTDAAVEAARLLSRGDRPAAERAVRTLAPAGAALLVRTEADRVHVEVAVPFPGDLLPGRTLHATAVAILEPGVAPDSEAAPEAGTASEPGTAPEPGAAPEPGVAPEAGAVPEPGTAPEAGGAP
ncbi:TadE family type IV pilus minor pilin [Saccharopolyspora cebuensis]|uniref:TadE family type IV pilus minor pilin n=1 Tax=Saccharopolyspora cebuensis TaxID=418759 RepID=A0ABV4CJA0_9PSEU